ncbi:hypothetical protein OUZ56_002036 [Daphnia magna]|uniref:Uncharacterized protein n=1 Tax=Daphnia magna TaxID=35525 RepID=A0ABR0A4I0_9CRUS|nr:hypothetical protein OUZ56_002036 [Daphnia magna]
MAKEVGGTKAREINGIDFAIDKRKYKLVKVVWHAWRFGRLFATSRSVILRLVLPFLTAVRRCGLFASMADDDRGGKGHGNERRRVNPAILIEKKYDYCAI